MEPYEKLIQAFLGMKENTMNNKNFSEDTYSNKDFDDFPVEEVINALNVEFDPTKLSPSIGVDDFYEIKDPNTLREILSFETDAFDEEIKLACGVAETKHANEIKENIEIQPDGIKREDNVSFHETKYYNTNHNRDNSSNNKVESNNNCEISDHQENLRTVKEIKRYKCNLCSYVTFRPDEMKVHEKCHVKETPFKCKPCGYTFLTAKRWRQHKLLHDNGSLYTCKQCGQTLTSEERLKKHEKLHEDKDQETCHVCHYTTTKKLMKLHEAMHVCFKPFVCKVCQCSFLRCSDLMAHEAKMNHKDETNNEEMSPEESVVNVGQAYFNCKLCGVMCTNVNDFNEHTKSHHGPIAIMT